MKNKYLAYYENEWPADIAELTAVENKPFVGYLKDGEVLFTVVPKPATGPADNEIWYTSSDGNVVNPANTSGFGANVVSNTYENGKGIITFDGDVTKIGYESFCECKSLTSITLGGGVMSIGGYAFCDCSALEYIILPNNLTSIGSSAFFRCSSLNNIIIPENVISIADDSFTNLYITKKNFTNNSSLDAETNNYWGATVYDYKIDGMYILGNSVVSVDYNISENITIPDHITTIKDNVFSDNQNIYSIDFKNVENIGNNAFYFSTLLSNLTNIIIGSNIKTIGHNAFYNCGKLSNITYNGTQEQWNAITKGNNWKYNVPATYVQCTDGQVQL